MLALVCLSVAVQPAQADDFRVFVLNSYHPEYIWAEGVVTAIKDEFSQSDLNYELFFEYMDTKRFYGEEYLEQLSSFLFNKYKDFHFDVIIAADENAIHFMLEHRDRLFPGIPLVFSGLNYYEPEAFAHLSHYTGQVEVIDIEPNLELVQRLHPDVKTVYYISDNTVSGRNLQRITREAEHLFPELEIRYLDGTQLSFAELQDQLRKLPPNSVAMLGIWLRDRNGVYFPREQAVPAISQAANVPVYGVGEMWLGYGIVGGKLDAAAFQGERAAKLAIKILRGTPASQLPVQLKSPNKYMFDNAQLERWGIDQSLLPAGSIIINQPPSSFITKNKKWLLLALAFLLLQSLIIVALIINTTLRRRTEAALRESESRFRQLVETMNEGIAVQDGNGVLIYVNDRISEVMGYRKDELLNRPLAEFFTDEGKKIFYEQIAKRHRGVIERYEIAFPNKAGELVQALVSPQILYDEEGNYQGSLAVISDITQWRRAEEDRQKLASVIDSSNEFIGLASLDGKIQYINAAGRRLLGLDEDEDVTHRMFSDFAPSDDYEFVTQAMLPTLMQEGAWHGENKLQNLGTGEVIELEINAFLLRSSRTGEPTGFAAIMRDISKRKQSERKLRASESKYRTLFDTSPESITLIGLDGKVIAINKAGEALAGKPREEMIGVDFTKLNTLHEQDLPSMVGAFGKLLNDEHVPPFELQVIPVGTGQPRWIEVFASLVRRGDQTEAIQVITRDIQEAKEAELRRIDLEAQLQQSQKLEAIGRLAGGVAHDFNNILTGIEGYAELILRTIEPADPIYDEIQEIKQAADRAAMLTQQLLAFSRKQVISPKIINLNRAIENSMNMLRRIIGEDIDFQFKPQPGIGNILIDPGQINQVLVNLTVNARDAMPDGGRLIIQTSAQTFDEAAARDNPEIKPGRYLSLAIADTGTGIDEETSKHIFEPFFTTKNKDQGTGLGLATVYGIVKQNNGVIELDSRPGEGTIFTLYFPAVDREAEPAPISATDEQLAGNETILLVEDEPVVRELARKVLQDQGYQIITAGSGGEAYLLAQQNIAEIDMLITDVIMPNMNGKQLYDRIKKLKPQLKVLFVSGYTEDVIANHGVLEEGTNFLQKPFSIEDLSRRVRKTLDS